MWKRSIVWILLCLYAFVGTGCMVHYVYDTDPEEMNAKRVKDTRGRNVQLDDGRWIQIAGIEDEGMMEAKFREDVIARAVIAVPEGSRFRIERLMRPTRYDKLSLFPRTVHMMPIRLDMGIVLIRDGIVRARPEEIAEPDRRRQYVRAETDAKLYGHGMWASDRARAATQPMDSTGR